MLSIIIPAYHEPYLGNTIESLLKNAEGEIEVIPVLDGWKPDSPLPQDTRVKPVILTQNKGARGATNAGIAQSTGEFIMKLDAHCAVNKGYDKILSKSCSKNWLMVPRKYSLDINNWEPDYKRPIVDYAYLSFPIESQWGFGMYARDWVTRRWARSKPEYDIDDIMTLQASCWVANRKYFLEHIYPLDDRPEAYGSIAQDQQELALKYWLKGGEVKVNKKTWYAHFAKRWYHYSQKVFVRTHKKDVQYLKGNTWGTWHWLNNEEPGIIYPFSWFIEKFWPVPEWPDNWQEILYNNSRMKSKP